ncbi:uncharacterized protein LOC116851879 isoform X2 [Odontomachus brunneus]|uniref:uncharacterized protein LOC116851879 isoform X2 n=1 Tax=Odontomachus brunneus TaxID=486640 RepID=UPI0013F22FD7|nr:uncharacterized protein LOC116851879 isoform X2 [Odontomachus brunneus]
MVTTAWWICGYRSMPVDSLHRAFTIIVEWASNSLLNADCFNFLLTKKLEQSVLKIVCGIQSVQRRLLLCPVVGKHIASIRIGQILLSHMTIKPVRT